MLTQEDLDKLLEEAQQKETAKDTPKADQEADLGWGDAFKEAASAGDKAAQKAFDEGRLEEEKPKQAPPAKPKKPAKEAHFSEFEKKPALHIDASMQNKPNLDFILEIPLALSVELGRTKMQIKELLQLSQGAIVPLEKIAGEPAEIYINNKLMAKGEIVVVNEKFGVRVTEIISPADRVKNLG
jgi:flagellar motor switch protein FliN/FliY